MFRERRKRPWLNAVRGAFDERGHRCKRGHRCRGHKYRLRKSRETSHRTARSFEGWGKGGEGGGTADVRGSSHSNKGFNHLIRRSTDPPIPTATAGLLLFVTDPTRSRPAAHGRAGVESGLQAPSRRGVGGEPSLPACANSLPHKKRKSECILMLREDITSAHRGGCPYRPSSKCWMLV